MLFDGNGLKLVHKLAQCKLPTHETLWKCCFIHFTFQQEGFIHITVSYKKLSQYYKQLNSNWLQFSESRGEFFRKTNLYLSLLHGFYLVIVKVVKLLIGWIETDCRICNGILYTIVRYHSEPYSWCKSLSVKKTVVYWHLPPFAWLTVSAS